jgi:lipopolysaccharide transport system ATP-binding protein
MSSEPLAIQVQGISKRFNIGTGRQGSSFFDRVGRLVGAEDRDPFGDASIWALRDISFELPPGEVLGLLGRNGSGKTTLVRILARVTAPTQGRAMVNGRVGALFQAGTGFHPELTGRENIELSGSILGMSREATLAAFDDIVAFAEIGEFLDSPVKYYSSGMYSRLAFSVSAHLDAEILLIDEALSVGDLVFSEKCTRHIRGMVRSGRTVVFVSHNLETVKALCDSAIVLEAGRMEYQGEAGDALEFYRDLANRHRGQPPQRSIKDSTA